MIDKVLVSLRKNVDEYLKSRIGVIPGSTESIEERVSFIDGEKMDPITFKLNTVSILLINIEEEKILRAADPYSQTRENGMQQKVQPAIRLNLYILFVANFKRYENSLSNLSMIIQFFQNHRLINQQNLPDLDEAVGPLSVELITLPFAEQNEIWNALRTTYHPSVLYKVKLVIFSDDDAKPVTEVIEKKLIIKEVSS